MVLGFLPGMVVGCGLGLRTREICMRVGRQDLTAVGVLWGGVCCHDLLLASLVWDSS